MTLTALSARSGLSPQAVEAVLLAAFAMDDAGYFRLWLIHGRGYAEGSAKATASMVRGAMPDLEGWVSGAPTSREKARRSHAVRLWDVWQSERAGRAISESPEFLEQP
jgi:hypothetical protein